MMEIRSVSKVDEYGRMYFVVTYREDDVVIEKCVDLDSYRKIIDGNIKEETKYVDVPLLPNEVLKASISSEGEMGGFKVLLYYEPQKGPFSYMGKIFRIPFPALLFSLKVGEKGQLMEKKVFALKECKKEFVTMDSLLYAYPFSNVYEGGNICMGNISANFKTIREALSFYNLFIEGRSNHDLFRNQNTEGLKQGQLLARIENMEQFPLDLLMETGQTIKNLL